MTFNLGAVLTSNKMRLLSSLFSVKAYAKHVLVRAFPKIFCVFVLKQQHCRNFKESQTALSVAVKRKKLRFILFVLKFLLVLRAYIFLFVFCRFC
jgi:hypothetical protein